ncbi:MAG: ATP synthase F0 subunit B [Myxococcaceae bacterium]|nr:ATP synthase F0 subunit B [Myxococcaceae bacterium]MBH2006160.1 ATP synthase F0 subunit B [Myxococcaceae bacterium]
MEVNSTLLVQLFLFLSLLAWLSKFLFAPMQKLFDERERRIEGARIEALRLQKEAQQRLEEVELRIHQAQKEARLALIALQAEGARFHREILDTARKQNAQELKAAQEALHEQIETVRAELLAMQPEISQRVSERLVDFDSNPTWEPTHA